jgi:UDP-2,3-diacylglucosamine pyrophosphatase LpxH
MGGAIEFVKRRSVQYVKDLGYQGVITGHTHFCDDEWIDGVHYMNTGCWTDYPCTYIAVKEKQIRLCYWRDSALQTACDSEQSLSTNLLVQKS